MAERRAVTVLELLVVLTILALFLGLLLPAVQSSRERARETVCKNNLHQINLAIAQFAEVRKQLPSPGQPGLVGGWTIEILPFIERKNLSQRIRPGTKIDDAGELLLRSPLVFQCPARDALDDIPDGVMAPSHYVFVPSHERESFMLFDAPVELQAPWASGPEMNAKAFGASIGPHHGGFHYANGFQHGVDFMPGGE
ncbi:MAG: DUF1559 domain-containing protein [Planctomycetaceae bacterium]